MTDVTLLIVGVGIIVMLAFSVLLALAMQGKDK
jgi:hypothetical protein